MIPNICNNCGGDYEYRHGKWICRACGSYKPEELSNEEVTLLYTAFQNLRLAKFSEAELEFDDIIQKYPKNPSGYWGRLLSKYGIKYEEDFDGRRIPTCYATSIESVVDDKNYLKAVEFADEDTKAYYQKQAEYIERVRKEWVEKARKEKPYDIFISYKESDIPNGIDRTQDSIAAQELYIHLTEQGYRVFFSRESLRDKVGEKYEPYIFNAISTAKVMLVYGSSPEYITSTWVKNEWTRYEKKIEAGEKKPNSLLVACDGFSPSELPSVLSSKQCFNANDRRFYFDLTEAVDKIIHEKKQEPIVVPVEKKRKSPKIAAFIAIVSLILSGALIWNFVAQSNRGVSNVGNGTENSSISINEDTTNSYTKDNSVTDTTAESITTIESATMLDESIVESTTVEDATAEDTTEQVSGSDLEQITHICTDKNNDHVCDFGTCDITLGTCFDSETDRDHICDYGCNKKFSECADLNKDHFCDICNVEITMCVDNDKDHVCDTCNVVLSTHQITGETHICNYCNNTISVCYDSELDHYCDICGKYISVHMESSGSHICSYCGKAASVCSDTDKNHYCDICSVKLSSCSDSNKDHKCDLCGTSMGVHSAAKGTHICNYCNKIVSECIDSDLDGYCDVCNAMIMDSNGVYTRSGNKIIFGSYPQSEVTNNTLKSILTNQAGNLPISGNSYKWQSYGYYSSGAAQNYMWYQDIVYEGEKYRGVYFTSYRPEYVGDSSSAEKSNQDNNGYNTNTVYWFKFEPIVWTVLTEDSGYAAIFCDMIIDAQAYQNDAEYSVMDGYNTSNGTPSGTYANNYAYSTIRKWLNETFLNTAFTDLQQQIIATVEIDNSTNSGAAYTYNNTLDKIFLLSYTEVNSAYFGFLDISFTSDPMRCKKTTEYAQVQGAYTCVAGTYSGNGHMYPQDTSL